VSCEYRRALAPRCLVFGAVRTSIISEVDGYTRTVPRSDLEAVTCMAVELMHTVKRLAPQLSVREDDTSACRPWP
jgi:hypothetical protein